MNNDILFDGLSDRDGLSRQKDKDGTPWWNGNPATSNRRTPWPTNRRRETEIPLFHHEEQTFCVTFYDHPDMNSFNTETDEEDRPGRSKEQCCTLPKNWSPYTAFCAYNLPTYMDNFMSSWTFRRHHRRRNAAKGSCLTSIIENTHKTLGECLKSAGEQTLFDLLPPTGVITIGDVRAASDAYNNCKESCSVGGKVLLNCANGLIWVAGGKVAGEVMKAGTEKVLGKVKDKLTKAALRTAVGGHIAAAGAGLGVSMGSCFIKEINSGRAACLAPSTVFRGPGQNNGVPLHSIDVESAITVVNVGSIGEEAVGQSKVASGTVLGFAKKNDNYTREYIELKTISGKSVRCTPKHFLWVKEADGISKLLLAEDVHKGHNLPVVGANGSVVEWEVIENITEEITEAGAVMPIARTSDWETADMVVTEAGIAVPIYAGGTEYSALNPSDAHNLFKAWLHHWSKLHAELPCLMKISHGTHGSMLLEVLQDYGRHHHAGKLGKVEMTPPEFLCYVYMHMDEFRNTIIPADLELALDCQGITEMIQACDDDDMRRRIEKDVEADEGGGEVVPDPIWTADDVEPVDVADV